MNHRLGFLRILALVGSLALLSPVPVASAAIRQIDARISAEVQQYDFGEPGSFDAAFEEFRTTSVNLPIQVTASLLPDAADASSNAFGALAVSDFDDPTASGEANPGEFGLEANVFSLDPLVSFDATADASEDRLIVLDATDLEAIEGETEREVQSSVFISGAVLVWTLDPTRDLSGVSVSFDFSVSQIRSGQSPEQVFSAFARVQGTSGGDINFNATEGINAEVGNDELLVEAIGPFGELLRQELAALGRIHVILIPESELVYSFTGPLDEEFDLVASLNLTSSNLPGGTGAGAVFGRSFEDLAGVIAEFIGRQSDGTLTQRAINKALSDLQAQDQDGNGGGGAPGGGIGCGVLGMEMMVLGLALVGLRFRGRRGE